MEDQMIDVRKIEKAEEIKAGMDIITVDHSGHEEFARVECVDGNDVWTKGRLDPRDLAVKEPLGDFLDLYWEVYELVGSTPAPAEKKQTPPRW
jgi:hypothetical protein